MQLYFLRFNVGHVVHIVRFRSESNQAFERVGHLRSAIVESVVDASNEVLVIQHVRKSDLRNALLSLFPNEIQRASQHLDKGQFSLEVSSGVEVVAWAPLAAALLRIFFWLVISWEWLECLLCLKLNVSVLGLIIEAL